MSYLGVVIVDGGAGRSVQGSRRDMSENKGGDELCLGSVFISTRVTLIPFPSGNVGLAPAVPPEMTTSQRWDPARPHIRYTRACITW